MMTCMKTLARITDAIRKHTTMPWLCESVIYLTRHGSWAYGTNVEGSDEDFKGIAIPPPEYFYGFVSKFDKPAESKEPDMVIHDIRRFMALAADCNPNIIETLWTDPSDRVIVREGGRELLAYRGLFLSKRARYSFSGFAHAQLKRISGAEDFYTPKNLKHALHLVRLYAMTREILEEHTVIVKRHKDRNRLLEIRRGENISHSWLVGWAKEQDAALDELYEKSTLRYEPDREWLNELCVEIVRGAIT